MSEVHVYMSSMQQTNKDELFVCPYDNAHRVSAMRFVRHLLKCRKNHPSSGMVSLCIWVSCKFQLYI